MASGNDRVLVTAIAPFTSWSSASGSTFQGYKSVADKTVAAKLTWSDNTIFPNALGSDVTNYMSQTTYLGFASSNPTVISIDAEGLATVGRCRTTVSKPVLKAPTSTV